MRNTLHRNAQDSTSHHAMTSRSTSHASHQQASSLHNKRRRKRKRERETGVRCREKTRERCQGKDTKEIPSQRHCLEKCSVPHEKSALQTHGRALFDTCFTGNCYRLKQLRPCLERYIKDATKKSSKPNGWPSLLQRIVGYELVEILGLSHIPLSTGLICANSSLPRVRGEVFNLDMGLVSWVAVAMRLQESRCQCGISL